MPTKNSQSLEDKLCVLQRPLGGVQKIVSESEIPVIELVTLLELGFALFRLQL